MVFMASMASANEERFEAIESKIVQVDKEDMRVKSGEIVDNILQLKVEDMAATQGRPKPFSKIVSIDLSSIVGKDGIDGIDGTNGANGIDGVGIDGTNGVDGIGIDGVDGVDGVGIDGVDGTDGVDADMTVLNANTEATKYNKILAEENSRKHQQAYSDRSRMKSDILANTHKIERISGRMSELECDLANGLSAASIQLLPGFSAGFGVTDTGECTGYAVGVGYVADTWLLKATHGNGVSAVSGAIQF
jgi:hypothetical protein